VAGKLLAISRPNFVDGGPNGSTPIFTALRRNLMDRKQA